MQNPLPGHDGLLRRPTVVTAIRWPSAAFLVLGRLLSYQATARRAASWKLRSWNEKCESSWKKLFVPDDSNSSLTLIYASKAKSDLPKSNGKTTWNNSPRSSELSSNLTMRLTLRHNETPWLHPSLAKLADLAMTPEELGSHGAKRSKRKPWREGNDGNIDISHEFFGASWILLCVILYSIYWFKSIFYWSSTGFDCHAWNLNYSDFFCN